MQILMNVLMELPDVLKYAQTQWEVSNVRAEKAMALLRTVTTVQVYTQHIVLLLQLMVIPCMQMLMNVLQILQTGVTRTVRTLLGPTLAAVGQDSSLMWMAPLVMVHKMLVCT